MFIYIGKGTLAPWDPPKVLIIQGVVGYVRNPMISGVLFILCGESLIFLSKHLFIWFIAFAIANDIYLSLFEEPALMSRFGAEYHEYKKNVPKWIPRMRPWKSSRIDGE